MELLGGLVELGFLGLGVDHAQRDFVEPGGLLTVGALEPDDAAPQGRLTIAQHFSAGSGVGMNQVPRGTAETDCLRLGRPCGTCGFNRRQPSTEVLGYFRASRQDG